MDLAIAHMADQPMMATPMPTLHNQPKNGFHTKTWGDGSRFVPPICDRTFFFFFPVSCPAHANFTLVCGRHASFSQDQAAPIMMPPMSCWLPSASCA